MTSRTHARSSRWSTVQVRFIMIAAILSALVIIALMIWTNWNLALVWILAWSLVTFGFYGYDKFRAKTNSFRVPETSLLVMAAAGGFVGALGGMLVFRHKTAKLKFWVVNIACLVIYGALVVLSLR